MKKSLSMFLALIMALPVFSGANLLANAQELQIKFNSANPITVVENVDGYWEEDSAEKEYFNYHYWFNEGDSFTVSLDDGSVRVYTYTQCYDEKEDWYYTDFVDENGNKADFEISVSDDQYENHWGVGTHKAEAVFYYDYEYAGSTDIFVTVVENPYSNVVYTPVKPVEIIEKHSSYGYWFTDDETGEENFFYYGYHPLYGDKITLQLKNGSETVYTYVNNEDEEADYFISSNGDMLEEYADYHFDSNEDDGWYPGCKNAKYTFEYFGLTCDIPVTIKENPYSSVEFVPVEPVQFIENYDGEIDYEADEPYFRYERYEPKDGDKLVVHFTDKSKNAKTLVYDSDSDRFVAADGSSIGDYWIYSNQCEEWEVGGKYTNYISVLGFDFEFPVEIVENPYKSVKFISVEPIQLIENHNGSIDEDENGNEYYYYYGCYGFVYNKGNIIEITMKDGNVVRYISDGDEFYAQGNIRLDFDYSHNQYEKHWVKGEENFITLNVFGCETKIPVSIIENPVKNAEFSVKSITCKENTFGHWTYNEETGEKYFIYSETFSLFKEGDTLTINMNDGTSRVYTCKENVSGHLYRANFFDEDNNILEISTDTSEQYNAPWGLGEHTAEIYISDYDVCAEIPIVITKGTQQDCWHRYYDENDEYWHNTNGYLEKVCIGCGYRVKIPFVDLGNYVYYGDFVEYTSVNNSFIKGTNSPEFTQFSPTTAITRAMFVTILYRMAGEPYANNNPYKTSPFTDITDTSVYYYDAACWALDKGITNQLTFKPFDNVTREQTASFLFRYADDTDNLGSEEYKNVDLSKYSDSKNISGWAEEAMQWANFNGMITGTQQGTANPQGATQRIHATKILYGFGDVCGIGNFA